MQNDFGGNSYPYEGELAADEKTMAMLAHILGIFTWFIGPLIIWAIKKDQSPFVKKHAMEALVFSLGLTVINIVIAIVACLLTFLCGLGFLLYFVSILLFFASILYFVLGAVRANEGKIWEYPLTSQFVK